MVRAKGAWLLFLPPYSPDLNPIEMAFAKLKALLRKHAARSFDAISTALGENRGSLLRHRMPKLLQGCRL